MCKGDYAAYVKAIMSRADLTRGGWWLVLGIVMVYLQKRTARHRDKCLDNRSIWYIIIITSIRRILSRYGPAHSRPRQTQYPAQAGGPASSSRCGHRRVLSEQRFL